MNTVGDILKLQEAGSISLTRTGLGMSESGKHFAERMRDLIGRTFFLLCLDKEKQSNLRSDQLPPIEEMCSSLKGVDQSTPLPQFAQVVYYCAAAVLLTMDGSSEEARESQYSRADMLMNSGVLPR